MNVAMKLSEAVSKLSSSPGMRHSGIDDGLFRRLDIGSTQREEDVFFWYRWTSADRFDNGRGVCQSEEPLVGRSLAQSGEIDVDRSCPFV